MKETKWLSLDDECNIFALHKTMIFNCLLGYGAFVPGLCNSMEGGKVDRNASAECLRRTAR